MELDGHQLTRCRHGLIVVLAFAAREFSPRSPYLRTRLLERSCCFSACGSGRHRQTAARIATTRRSPKTSSRSSTQFYGTRLLLHLAIRVPMVEEVFYRHILRPSSAHTAPTWLVASFSRRMFAYMRIASGRTSSRTCRPASSDARCAMAGARRSVLVAPRTQ